MLRKRFLSFGTWHCRRHTLPKKNNISFSRIWNDPRFGMILMECDETRGVWSSPYTIQTCRPKTRKKKTHLAPLTCSDRKKHKNKYSVSSKVSNVYQIWMECNHTVKLQRFQVSKHWSEWLQHLLEMLMALTLFRGRTCCCSPELGADAGELPTRDPLRRWDSTTSTLLSNQCAQPLRVLSQSFKPRRRGSPKGLACSIQAPSRPHWQQRSRQFPLRTQILCRPLQGCSVDGSKHIDSVDIFAC